MKVQHLLGITHFFFLATQVMGQSITDFFIPENQHNKASYETFISEAPKAFSTDLFFEKVSENKYNIGVQKFSHIQANEAPNKIKVERQIIEINRPQHQIELTKEIRYGADMAGAQKEKINYSPPKVIFKMPDNLEKVEWQYSESTGDKHKCTSEMITLNVKGEKKKAVKVVDKAFSNGKHYKLHSKVKYYVKGVGLWKVEGFGDSNPFLKELADLSNGEFSKTD